MRRFFCLLSVLLSFLPHAYGLTFNSTALIVGTPDDDGTESTYILDGYGIPYESAILGSHGAALPPLESAAGGHYGLLIVISQPTYLTESQWNTLYAYQQKYGVRMIQLSVFPSSTFGVTASKSCCSGEIEQFLNIVPDVASAEFPAAGLRLANLSTVGLYHYPATIISANRSTTTAFMEFLPNSVLAETTVAGVINRLDDREQMAFFTTSGNWSTTSAYFNHIWVQWGYRGLYQGQRRIHLQTQVDDLFLTTTTYNSARAFRVRPADLAHHIDWSATLNERLNRTNPGSHYFAEFGFNANGNLAYEYGIAESNVTTYSCAGPMFTSWEEPNTGLEYIKPLGTGRNSWPKNPTFDWTSECVFLDPLAQFFHNITHRDAFGLVSHTFTHLDLDKATYHDVLREISFNLMFAELLNFTNALKFSGSGLIPPAITGMHNGDALRAFADNGLWNCVGDNTRPVLRNSQNYHWPRLTDLEINGYRGYQITPRFSTRIYYNCDLVSCDVQQCIDTADCPKHGGMQGLLDLERRYVPNQLLSLFHDPYMFHQPNLRQIDMEEITIDGVTEKLSLLAMWVRTITDELVRLVDWPIISLKHDHIASSFNRRLVRDACGAVVQYHTSPLANGSTAVTSVTVMANGGRVDSSLSGNVTIVRKAVNLNKCNVPIPVTFPRDTNVTAAAYRPTSNAQALIKEVIDQGTGFRREQIGNDPLTVWVRLDGQPVTLNIAGDGILV